MTEIESGGLVALLRDETIPVLQEIISLLEGRLKVAVKRRRDCLIAKTTGTTVAVAGTSVTLLAVALAPLTFGLTAFLTTPSIVVTLIGTGTSLGTSFVDNQIQKRDSRKLQEILKRFEETESEYANRVTDSPQLRTEELSAVEVVSEDRPDLQNGRENYIRLWLMSTAKFYNDENIQVNQLRDGDHIYREMIVPGTFHHGVYIGEDDGVKQVVDFGSDNDDYPVIRPLQQFSNTSTLFRRNYNGYDVVVADTIVLARRVAQDRNWEHYSLFRNNCEHFATYLKLNVMWSEQVAAAYKKWIENPMQTSKLAPKVIQGVVDVGSTVAMKGVSKIMQQSFSSLNSLEDILSGLYVGAVGTNALSKVAKFSMILAPISIVLDISALVSDFRRQQPNIARLQEAVNYFKSLFELKTLILAYLEGADDGYQESPAIDIMQ